MTVIYIDSVIALNALMDYLLLLSAARLAGLPEPVLKRAKAVLRDLEEEHNVQYAKPREEREQVSLTAIGEGEVLDALRRCQPDALSAKEALDLLYEWKQKLE